MKKEKGFKKDKKRTRKTTKTKEIAQNSLLYLQPCIQVTNLFQ